MTAKLLETLTLAEVALMDVFDYDNVKQALAAIREAKAELEKQEPVADPYNGDDGPGFDYEFHEKLKAGLHLMSFDEQKLWNAGWDAAKAFYAAPVPVTTPDVCGEVCARAKLCYGCGKALDESNAKFTEQEIPMTDTELINANCRYTTPLMAEQTEQRSGSEQMEPVAWANPSGGYLSARYMKGFATGLEKETYTIPLYAAPLAKQVTPVTQAVRTKDLTNDEIDEIESEILMGGGEYIDVIRAVIAADREKNK